MWSKFPLNLLNIMYSFDFLIFTYFVYLWCNYMNWILIVIILLGILWFLTKLSTYKEKEFKHHIKSQYSRLFYSKLFEYAYLNNNFRVYCRWFYTLLCAHLNGIPFLKKKLLNIYHQFKMEMFKLCEQYPDQNRWRKQN